MSNCREFLLDDLMAVVAIPVGDFAPASDWLLRPTIGEDVFNPTLDNAVTIGVAAAVDDGVLIPIMRGSGKVGDEESDGVAGRLHTVKVTCQVDDRDFGVCEGLLALERTPSHLLLAFRDAARAFVHATEDTYLCTVERDGRKTTVTIRVQDLMGVQMIV